MNLLLGNGKKAGGGGGSGMGRNSGFNGGPSYTSSQIGYVNSCAIEVPIWVIGAIIGFIVILFMLIFGLIYAAIKLKVTLKAILVALFCCKCRTYRQWNEQYLARKQQKKSKVGTFTHNSSPQQDTQQAQESHPDSSQQHVLDGSKTIISDPEMYPSNCLNIETGYPQAPLFLKGEQEQMPHCSNLYSEWQLNKDQIHDKSKKEMNPSPEYIDQQDNRQDSYADKSDQESQLYYPKTLDQPQCS